MMYICCFFFQAEDGILRFCLSRGRGEVYKSQDDDDDDGGGDDDGDADDDDDDAGDDDDGAGAGAAFTIHLTPPTNGEE